MTAVDEADVSNIAAFLDVGVLPTLHDRYGISTKMIAERIKAWM
jgi:transketolase C-terminal domain/subunit